MTGAVIGAESVLTGGLTAGGFMLCLAASLVFGVISALIYKSGTRCSRNFTVTLALLPSVVQSVIMLVNGNIGAGVAVAGAFSLVRFRSIPGNSRDITAIFSAMALGFMCGMGYLFVGAVFLVVFCAAMKILYALPVTAPQPNLRTLKITIPENLDYDSLFDSVFAAYLASFELERVRTTAMGSLFELTYRVQLKSADVPKAFIDGLRVLNGNLTVSVSREIKETEEL